MQVEGEPVLSKGTGSSHRGSGTAMAARQGSLLARSSVTWCPMPRLGLSSHFCLHCPQMITDTCEESTGCIWVSTTQQKTLETVQVLSSAET